MGLLRQKKPTKQQKRLELYADRFAAAGTARARLGHAFDFVRAVCAEMPPEQADDVARQLFEFARNANGA